MQINSIIIILVVVFTVSLFIFFLPKIKDFFSSIFAETKSGKSNKNNKKKSKKKKGKKKDQESDKLKSSKAATEFRPIVKPPNKEKEKAEAKQIEAKQTKKEEEKDDKKDSKKDNKKTNEPEPKSLDFKYSSKPTVPNISPKPSTYPAINVKPKPTKEELDKEFEDIRNFLDLPENKKGGNLQQKYNETKMAKDAGLENPFKNIKRIDASLFNEPSSHYADYREDPSSLFINSVSSSNSMRTNTKYTKPVPYNENARANPKPLTYKIDRTPVDLKSMKRNLNYDNDDFLNFEEENIDLNKLSPRLKRLIITNILNRKKFD